MLMSVVEIVKTNREGEMASLNKDDYLRIGMSYNNFVGDFSKLLAQATEDKKLLMAVGRYISFRTGRREDKKVYNMVRDGRGDVDTLNDNITMVSDSCEIMAIYFV
jgi:hypothetical protein